MVRNDDGRVSRFGPNPLPPIVRFMRHVERDENGCWLWTGFIHPKTGYVQFHEHRQNTPNVVAHRWSYEFFIGPIPDGLVLDHLCRVRHCMNPFHLEPVTMAENNARGNSISAINARKTHCKHGHPLSGNNLYVAPNGKRACQVCRRKAERRYKERQASSG